MIEETLAESEAAIVARMRADSIEVHEILAEVQGLRDAALRTLAAVRLATSDMPRCPDCAGHVTVTPSRRRSWWRWHA
jgi:hypothetical protein